MLLQVDLKAYVFILAYHSEGKLIHLGSKSLLGQVFVRIRYTISVSASIVWVMVSVLVSGIGIGTGAIMGNMGCTKEHII